MEPPNIHPPYHWGSMAGPAPQQTILSSFTVGQDVAQAYEHHVRAGNQDTMRPKRDSGLESNQLCKRLKHTKDGPYTRLESETAVKTHSDHFSDDSISDTDFEEGEIDPSIVEIPTPHLELVAGAFTIPPRAPVPPTLTPLPALPSPGNPSESGAEFIREKLVKLADLAKRTQACHTELERIGVEMWQLEHQAPFLVSSGNTKWLVLRVATLAEERHAVRMVLDKINQKQLSRKYKLEKQRRQARAKKRQLEEKRLANTARIEAKGEDNIVLVDLTEGLRVVKNNPDAMPEVPNASETKAIQGVTENEEMLLRMPEIKMESTIKLEEE